MADTATTMFDGARIVKEAGAKYVIAAVDHALANSKQGGKSFEDKLAESDLDELVVTNTRPDFLDRVLNDSRLRSKTTVLSIAPLLQLAIRRDQEGDTIREMVAKIGKRNLYKIAHQAGT